MYRPYTLPESLPAETVRGFSADLTGLIAWLSEQDPEKEYCLYLAGTCLFGQFHEVLGIPPVVYFDDCDGIAGLDARYQGAWFIAATGKRTFGAALERARSALREGGVR